VGRQSALHKENSGFAGFYFLPETLM
jgi:hypothetical protein